MQLNSLDVRLPKDHPVDVVETVSSGDDMLAGHQGTTAHGDQVRGLLVSMQQPHHPGELSRVGVITSSASLGQSTTHGLTTEGGESGLDQNFNINITIVNVNVIFIDKCGSVTANIKLILLHASNKTCCIMENPPRCHISHVKTILDNGQELWTRCKRNTLLALGASVNVKRFFPV